MEVITTVHTRPELEIHPYITALMSVKLVPLLVDVGDVAVYFPRLP